MASTYSLDPVKGNDNGSGSLVDPWRTLTRAIAAPNSTVNLQPGCYPASKSSITQPISIVALGQVTFESAIPCPTWTQVQLGPWTVWQAAVTMPQAARQATWTDAAGISHRVPLWASLPVLFDTAAHWANSVLNPLNPHTRWGMWSTSTDLYLIPPADGSWTDPNAAHVMASAELAAFYVNGPDFHMSGPISVVGHQMGIRLSGTAQRAVFDGLTLRNNGVGIADIGNLPTTYGSDHTTQNCHFEDDLSSLRPGQVPVPHQMISWNIIKGVLLAYDASKATVGRAITSAESVGYWTQGGSSNSVVQDCVFDGTFDGASHFMEDDRYDANADTNLLIERCHFHNHGDDSLDRSRYQNNVRVEDCTFYNVGTIVSPAPLWGSLTLNHCVGALIGGQSRVSDGLGNRPHGSVIKYGANSGTHLQGHLTIEDSQFWSDDPTTQGICPDGGDGVLVPTITLENTTIRVGGLVVNWGSKYPHPVSWLNIDAASVLSTTAVPPMKTNLAGIRLTPVATVDHAAAQIIQDAGAI